MKEKVELMAPAGSWESLMAAIQGGADSVYFGVEQLNMRAKSTNNFTVEDLARITEVCKQHGVKSYLTLNTIVYDHDIRLMKKILDASKANHISAVIASDQAVLNYAFSIGLPVHISTQLNISNIEAVKFYAHFADVMVLARELSLRQVSKIVKSIKIEDIRGPSGNLVQVEIFAHGALCMAISGKCYLSLHENNASANRGACMQTCRKAYIVTEKETGNQLEIDNEYIMSPKDLNTIGFLDKVLDTGISVLKIEGRARAPEYVETVTRCYHEAIEACENGQFTKEKIKAWENELKTIYNRGFWDGYYLGRKLGEWSSSYGSQATKRKIYLSRGLNYFAIPEVAEFQMESGDLKVGDEILITGPSTGIYKTKVNELRVDDKPVLSVSKGDSFSIPVTTKVRRSDKLYKLVDVDNR